MRNFKKKIEIVEMNHNSDNLRKATTYFYYSQTIIDIGKKTRYVIYDM